MTTIHHDNQGMAKPLKNSPSKALMIVSDNIKLLKEKHGWAQADLGRMTGLQQKQISRLLNRENEITLGTLSQIAEGLRIPEPVLLCPGMDARYVPTYSSIRDDIRSLIDALVHLEKDGKLTEGAVAFIRASVALATQGNISSAESGKSAAQ
jgi:transcriptional regulator with XRE-family HTH domain